MKRWLVTAAALLVLFALAGFLGAASGIVPIKASSGHFAITEGLLQFGKRRSVATHTLGVELPAGDEDWLVLKGAGHYETGCRWCHGSPEQPRPGVARAMTPPPPYLAPRIAEWKPEELFYIVKHGIKFTGMPAWPSQQRDDEVRAMVAFLLALPDLDAQEYRRLVFGNAPDAGTPTSAADRAPAANALRAVIASCARCHGADGSGRGSAAFPKIAGQRREYLFNALRAFAHDQRHSGIMQPVAAGLSAAEMRQLADHYGGLATSPRPEEASAARPPTDGTARALRGGASSIARGREIAARGIPGQRVPSCADCHGPAPRRRNPAYPRLAGQYADYLVLQLELFKQDQRGGSRYAHLMRKVAPRLSTQQMRDVAAYYASLPAHAEPAVD